MSARSRDARTDGTPAAPTASRRLIALLRELYREGTPRAHRFRYGLLLLDALAVLFVVTTSFLPRTLPVLVGDVALGVLLLGEFVARLLAEPRPLRLMARLGTAVDAVAVLSFLLAPLFGHAAGFLRVLRTVRLLRARPLLERLRADVPGFRAAEEPALAAADLAVFIFVMTGLVFESQHRTNPEINDYADALYFTVTALTTTGFGDITLPGAAGRMITVVIMICGVTLFLRLAQALFRPGKVRFPCPVCALQRHDPDAVHCKACGTVLGIPDEGL